MKLPQFSEAAVVFFFFPNDASGMQGPTEQDGALLGWGGIPGVLDC